MKRLLFILLIAWLAIPCEAAFHTMQNSRRRVITFGTAYQPYAAYFDGSNDQLTLASIANASSSCTAGTISFWAKMDAGSSDTTAYDFMYAGGYNFFVNRTASKKINFLAKSAAGTSVLAAYSTGAFIGAASNYVHVCISWDLAVENRIWMSANANTQAVTITGFVTGSNYNANLSNYQICGPNRPACTLSEFVFMTNYIAPSGITLFNVDNRPTGTPPPDPLIYLRLPYDQFQTNCGIGGNFTVTGALTEGTPP